MFGIRKRRPQLTRQQILSQRPVSSGYATPFRHSVFYHYEDRPPFSLLAADYMRFDPKVTLALAVRNGLLLNAGIEIEGGRPEVVEFVKAQWEKLWSCEGSKILDTKNVGYCGFEIMYRKEKQGPFAGRIVFDKLKDFHPRDTRPLIQKAKVVGISLRAVRNPRKFQHESTPTGLAIWSPKSLWLTFRSRHGSWFGESLLEHAYPPWFEKWMRGGAVKLRQLRMVKDAWVGDRVRYPTRQAMIQPDGSVLSWRDIAREIVENRYAGGVFGLPSDRDKDGNYLIDYEPPTAVDGATQIFEYKKELDGEILEALETPGEVLEAMSSGSGFSGRSIPFVAFLAILQEEFADYVRQIDEQILRNMVRMNFGVEPYYKVKPSSLIETVNGLMGDGGGGGGGGGGEDPNSMVPFTGMGQKQGNGGGNFAPNSGMGQFSDSGVNRVAWLFGQKKTKGYTASGLNGQGDIERADDISKAIQFADSISPRISPPLGCTVGGIYQEPGIWIPTATLQTAEESELDDLPLALADRDQMDSAGAHWITIGGKSKPGTKSDHTASGHVEHSGGQPVLISADGTILAGPKWLRDKGVTRLGGKKKEAKEEVKKEEVKKEEVKKEDPPGDSQSKYEKQFTDLERLQSSTLSKEEVLYLHSAMAVDIVKDSIDLTDEQKDELWLKVMPQKNKLPRRLDQITDAAKQFLLPIVGINASDSQFEDVSKKLEELDIASFAANDRRLEFEKNPGDSTVGGDEGIKDLPSGWLAHHFPAAQVRLLNDAKQTAQYRRKTSIALNRRTGDEFQSWNSVKDDSFTGQRILAAHGIGVVEQQKEFNGAKFSQPVRVRLTGDEYEKWSEYDSKWVAISKSEHDLNDDYLLVEAGNAIAEMEKDQSQRSRRESDNKKFADSSESFEHDPIPEGMKETAAGEYQKYRFAYHATKNDISKRRSIAVSLLRDSPFDAEYSAAKKELQRVKDAKDVHWADWRRLDDEKKKLTAVAQMDIWGTTDLGLILDKVRSDWQALPISEQGEGFFSSYGKYEDTLKEHPDPKLQEATKKAEIAHEKLYSKEWIADRDAAKELINTTARSRFLNTAKVLTAKKSYDYSSRTSYPTGPAFSRKNRASRVRDKRLKKNCELASKAMGEMLDEDIHGGLFTKFAQLRKNVDQRAFASHRGEFQESYISAIDDDLGTVAHEMGHNIENNNLTAGHLARGFLAHRVQGEEPKYFKKLFPSKGYGADEKGNEDHFGKAFEGVDSIHEGSFGGETNAWYTGKSYDHGSTEILSMGVQLLVYDPVGFADRDPEYFDFVTGILDGSLIRAAETKWGRMANDGGFFGREGSLQLSAIGLLGERLERQTAHAPAGGVTIGGKFFDGGQYIPGKFRRDATSEELLSLNPKPGAAAETEYNTGSKLLDVVSKALGYDITQSGGTSEDRKPSFVDDHALEIDGHIEDRDAFDALEVTPEEADELLEAAEYGGHDSLIAGVRVDEQYIRDAKYTSPLSKLAQRQSDAGFNLQGEEYEAGDTTFDGGNWEPEESPDYDEFMRNHYPAGDSWVTAGFLLNDGTLLDMGGGSGQRAEDHRSINPTDEAAERWGYSEAERSGRTTVLIATMKRARAIRIDGPSGSIHTETYPSSSQRQAIRDWVDSTSPEEVYIDAGKGSASLSWPSSRDVLDAIEDALDKGSHRDDIGQFSNTAHAPVGGVTVAGKKFDGGQFIPVDVLAKANPIHLTRAEYDSIPKPEKKPNDFIHIKLSKSHKVEVIQNPTGNQIRKFSMEVKKEFPDYKDAKLRWTNDKLGNRYLWKAHEAIHSQIEERIQKVVGEDLNQNNEYPSHRDFIRSAIEAGEEIPERVISGDYEHWRELAKVAKTVESAGVKALDMNYQDGDGYHSKSFETAAGTVVITDHGVGSYTARIGGKVAGQADLATLHSRDFLTNVRVHNEYRRQGIATAMYDYIEERLGYKLRKSPHDLTDSGQSFRDDRDKPDVQLSNTEHAPVGGVTIGGKKFDGGQFIPNVRGPMDDPGFSTRGGVKVFEIGDPKDPERSYLTLHPVGSESNFSRMSVGVMRTNPTMRRKGHATLMIEAAAKYAHSQGAALGSGMLTTPESRQLWEKKEQQGIARRYGHPTKFGGQYYEIPVAEPEGAAAQTDTPEFKKWFGGSKVVDDSGKPMIVFHSTNADEEFDTFRVAGLSAHFGSDEASDARAEDLREFSENVVGRKHAKARDMQVYLRIENPLEMPDLAGVYQTERAELIDADEVEDRLDEFYQDDEDNPKHPNPMSWEDETDFSEWLYINDHITRDQFWDVQYDKDKAVEILKENGYDGIAYENVVESPGSISYVPFDANQIKSATGNSGKFDSENPNILLSDTEHAPAGGVTIGGKFFDGGQFIPLHRGVGPVSPRKGHYYSTDRDWAKQFTQSGRDEEVSSLEVHSGDIFDAGKGRLPSATNEAEIDAAIKKATAGGYRGFMVDEGKGEPSSVFFVDKIHGGKPGGAAKKLLRQRVIKTMELTDGKDHFKTGQSVTFSYIRNNAGAPSSVAGDPYQQNIEPSGRYMNRISSPDRSMKGWETGKVTFNSPLVIPENTGDKGEIYGEDSWKANLSKHYGDKTGKALSQAIFADGFDGIVTAKTKFGSTYTGEIVDLTWMNPDPMTESAEFKKWFGGSKVVDDSGKPLTVHHVTDAKFDKFDPDKAAMGGVFWFTSNKSSIESGETGAGLRPGKTQIVIDAYLSIQKMAGWDEYEKLGIGELKREGFDGVKLDDNYIVFDANQIKSATGNSGKFDPENPNILLSDTEHAPAGGVTIGGKKFEGGQFIPGDSSAKPKEYGQMTLEEFTEALAPWPKGSEPEASWKGHVGRAISSGLDVPDDVRQAFEASNEAYRKKMEHIPKTIDPATVPQKWDNAGDFDDFDVRDPSDDGFYYHITTVENAKSIVETGTLDPASVETTMAEGFYTGHSAGFVFLTDRGGVNYWRNTIENHLESQERDADLKVLRIPKAAVGDLPADNIGTSDARHPAYKSPTVVGVQDLPTGPPKAGGVEIKKIKSADAGMSNKTGAASGGIGRKTAKYGVIVDGKQVATFEGMGSKTGGWRLIRESDGMTIAYSDTLSEMKLKASKKFAGTEPLQDLPTGPPKTKPVRFEAGKKLSKEQKSEVLKNLGDVYKDSGLKRDRLVGYNHDGDPIWGYPIAPELFITSSITGAKVRYYVTLPDGGKAHPTELFPNFTKTDIDRAKYEQEYSTKMDERDRENRNKRIHSEKNRANYLYNSTNRKLPGSYFAQNESGEVVRVDGSDPKDIAHFESEGFFRITKPVGGKVVEFGTEQLSNTEHAPAGGVTIGGKKFEGGQFIPNVTSSLDAIISLQADLGEKRFKGTAGWHTFFDTENTREDFDKNWKKALKGAISDAATVAKVEAAVDEAIIVHGIPSVPVVVRERIENDHWGEGGHYDNGFIVIQGSSAREKPFGERKIGDQLLDVKGAWGNRLIGLYAHEVGHFMTIENPEIMRRARAALNSDKGKSEAKKHVSMYGATLAVELAAECYSLKKHPEFNKLSAESREFIDNILGQ